MSAILDPFTGTVGVPMHALAGEAIVPGNFVAISGFDATTGLHKIVNADSDAGKPAVGYCPAGGASGARVTWYDVGELTGQNTNSGNVGDPVYLSGTAGGWSLTIPTGAEEVPQQVGVVTVKSATVGKIALLTKYLPKGGGGGIPYKIDRGEHQQAAASDTVATNLATVVAVTVTPRSRTVKQLEFAASVGDQAGSPAAGSFLLLSYKPTAVNDVTPVAATDFTDLIKVNWIAVGT